ncbi:MAG: pyridoxal phosphate-dependent aminotransferase family protein [Flavobacteriales bacterium]|nr:pyridoxal phosphate-dependent aminotransferase family protein [Flavobacteriales bacterium]
MDYKLLEKLNKRREEGTFRYLSLSNSAIDFFSNDYLGFARDSISIKSTNLSIGATGSRLLSGNSKEALSCETFLSKHFNVESSLVFNSGYTANLSLLSTIPQRGDTILYDDLVHASIRDGIRLSFAKAISFNHNDLNDLESKIKTISGSVYVVVESLYSMNGDISPLKEIASICAKNNSFLIVDEAHSVGVFGSEGRGLVHELNLDTEVFARVITFGKAYGFHGAAILGSKSLIDFLVNFARPFIYTTGLPPSDYSIIESLVNNHSIQIRQSALQTNIEYFRKDLIDSSCFPSDLNSPIQIIQTADLEQTIALAERLKNKGIYTKPIFSPTVPKGKECVRICLHSFNSQEEISLLKSLL